MNEQSDNAATGGEHAPLSRIQRGLVAVSASIVAVLAIPKAAHDFYVDWRDLPRNEVEKVNIELFKKYLPKNPADVRVIEVKTDFGKAEAKMFIYDEGDIYVEFGSQSQWLAFPKFAEQKTSADFSLISSAYAAPFVSRIPLTRPITSQNNTLNGSVLTQRRVFLDGQTEETQFDIRTGQILGTTVFRPNAVGGAGAGGAGGGAGRVGGGIGGGGGGKGGGAGNWSQMGEVGNTGSPSSGSGNLISPALPASSPCPPWTTSITPPGCKRTVVVKPDLVDLEWLKTPAK